MVSRKDHKQQPENQKISNYWLGELSAFVARRMGLRFGKDRWPDLERGLGYVADELGFEDLEACVRWVLSSPLGRSQIEAMAGFLTVGETCFLRNQAGLETLEKRILPDLIKKRRGGDRHLKIWSAGCCTGEEAYSIAILLHKHLPDFQEWNIDIIGTDINPRFIEKASRGVYKDWSFRQTPKWLKTEYFSEVEGGRYEIAPRIKAMVDFSYLNLAEDVYPSFLNNIYAVDVIFCCNVLLYFVPEKTAKVLNAFQHCLVEGGWLIAAPSDLVYVKCAEFQQVQPGNPILFRKEDSAAIAQSAGAGTDPDGNSQPSPEFQSGLHATPPHEISSGKPDDEASKWQPPGDDQVYETALNQYENGHYEETAQILLAWIPEFVESRPGKQASRPMALLARAFANQGKLAEALNWCDKAITKAKLEPALHCLRASILQEKGGNEEVAESLNRALFLDPENVPGHFAMGNLALALGEHRKSKKHFINALKLLNGKKDEVIVPDSGGISVGQLFRMITSVMEGTLDHGKRIKVGERRRKRAQNG